MALGCSISFLVKKIYTYNIVILLLIAGTRVGAIGNIFPSFYEDWTDLSNAQSIGSFFGVTIGPESIIAVGIDGLIAKRDHEEGSWTIIQEGGDPDFRDVIFANEIFIAVGEGGKLLTSSDGSIWIERSSGVTNDLRNILWDGNRFLVGTGGGDILVSSDGVSWTKYETGSSIVFNAIAYNGESYIAVGGYGMLYSTDAINWTVPTSPHRVFQWNVPLGLVIAF